MKKCGFARKSDERVTEHEWQDRVMGREGGEVRRRKIQF